MDTGPISYENWKAFLQEKPIRYTFEFPMFTDAHITGQISEGCGPYQLLNTVPLFKQETIVPSIILRVAEHLENDPPTPEMDKTDTARYHGGSLSDEIAALMSLCLGIRLKASGCIRMFEPGGDPQGRPEMHSLHLDPVLIKPRGLGAVLPHAEGTHSINAAYLFPKFPEIAPNDAIALIKAARLYQNAVWISESEPSLSWIFLVSAVETAAHHWRHEKESPVDRLRSFKPKLESILLLAGGPELVQEVAELISDYMGSTRKFLDFSLTYRPEPPEKRPSGYSQHPWDQETLEKSLRKIYDWRSRALHGGTPFPEPMCRSPVREDDAYHEKPLGLAASSKGAVWVADDIPMLLHVFEYIVRNALLSWWESMLH